MRKITTAERRNRLGVGHYLARPAADVELVASSLVGLHSSDPATVYLSGWARVAGFETADLENALYEHKTLVRVLGMRRTMFVTPLDLASVVNAACTRALVARERNRLIGLLEAQGVAADGSAWLAEVRERVLGALDELGEATAVELTREVPELANRLHFGEGKTWAGTVGVSTRVLFLLATEGAIVRTRPLGSWISSRYRWSGTRRWLGAGLEDIDADRARTDLVRRWLRSFGPGTLGDIKWWTGWNVGQTRSAVDACGAVAVDLGAETGYVLPGDEEPGPESRPWVALLPGLDPTVMGWKERHWYLGEYQSRLFDRNGNAGPTVWCNGRIVGGWTQASNGRVVFELLEDIGKEAGAQVEFEAHRLERWLGEIRVTPRFRSPLDRELST